MEAPTCDSGLVQRVGYLEAGRRCPGHLPYVYPVVDSAREGGAGGVTSLPLWPKARSTRSPGDTWLGPASSPARAQEQAQQMGTCLVAYTWRVGGLGQECIYKPLSSEQIPFYSNLWPVPGALVGTPHPAPPAPLPSGVLSLCHFVILAQTAIYGGQHFLPLFPLPIGPLAPSQKHSQALSNPPVLGAAEAGGRGPQLGPPIVHWSPHPMSPTPPTPCPTGVPWPTQWGNFQI